MRFFLFLFLLTATLSKAQNDTVTFFAFTDNNNNCLYEPTVGEVPLINYCFKFQYKDVISGIQSSFNLTDASGMMKMPATNPAAIANNTLTTSADVGALSSCYSSNVNYAYNATYTVPVFQPGGFKDAVILNMPAMNMIGTGGAIPSMPGAVSYCIGKTYPMPHVSGYNHVDNSTVLIPVTLNVSGGSSDVQPFYINYYYPTSTCINSNNHSGIPVSSVSPGIYTNPELRTTGIYTVTYSNMASGSGTYVFVVDSCSSYTGNVFVDCNANCMRDVTEYSSSDEVITSGNGTYSTTVIPDYNGNYNILSPYSSAQYTMNITPDADFALACATPSGSVYTAGAFSGPFVSINILNQTAVNSINYASMVLHPYSGSSVPGGSFKFDAFYWVSHPDYCALLNNSGSFYIKLDPHVQFVSVGGSTPAYTAIYPSASGDSIVWSIADLRQRAINMTGVKFTVNLSMSTTAVIGSNYCLSAGVVSLVTETNAADNRASDCWVIGGPFDPNYKEVFPKGTGAQGNIPPTTGELAYTIHFQNVGTAPAVDVKIKDLLDNNLDKASLKVTASSHPVQTNISSDGLVTFLFDNIILADSTHDEPNSHGFVSYKIRLKPNPTIGTQIKNTAAIYFDYNAPVITNTVVNTIWVPGSSVGMAEAQQVKVAVFPNPVQNLVSLETSEMIVSLKILNVLGEQVRELPVNARYFTFDVSDLAPNIYFLEMITSDNRSIIKKMVKD